MRMNQEATTGAGASLPAKIMLAGTLLVLSGMGMVASADDTADHTPDKMGHFGIGHTTLVVTDTSRNLDGSTPATGSGRPLYVHIWYPTNMRTNQHVSYTWNDPVY